ncbi:hypothetical protein [Tsukamurella tyrosinosolvens]|uniref:hypothetical protein n=1 Tax=Tsukamurella tyrosinosolvens TaxID=57704 RepID=UPI003F4A3D94
MSFGSRNNDIAGWWGIGLLCRTAGPSGIDIDLRDDAHGDQLARRYGMQLIRQLRARRLPGEWIVSAWLHLRFVSDPVVAGTWRYTVIVDIVDDRGRAWSARDEGRCWAHDPARESRSVRMKGDTIEFRPNV